MIYFINGDGDEGGGDTVLKILKIVLFGLIVYQNVVALILLVFCVTFFILKFKRDRKKIEIYYLLAGI